MKLSSYPATLEYKRDCKKLEKDMKTKSFEGVFRKFLGNLLLVLTVDKI